MTGPLTKNNESDGDATPTKNYRTDGEFLRDLFDPSRSLMYTDDVRTHV